MAAEKVTVMVLKVDLECSCCYKKVKKLLCKFPQIRDQVYDEKANTVTITVVCCSPEKIRDKLCCKGGKTIKSIEIKTPPPKPKEPVKEPVEKPKAAAAAAPAEKPKAPPAEKPKPKEPPEKKPQAAPKVVPVPVPEPKGPKAPEPAAPKPKAAPPPPEPAAPSSCQIVPAHGYPSIFPPCCGPCSEGRGGGPCYHAYGPGPCYDHNYGYNYNNNINHGYGGRPCYVSRCDYYFNEDNTTSACSIM